MATHDGPERPCAECLALPTPRDVLCVVGSGRDESARFAMIPLWLWFVVIMVIGMALWALWFGVELRVVVVLLVAVPVILGLWITLDRLEQRTEGGKDDASLGRERVVMRLVHRGPLHPFISAGGPPLPRRRPLATEMGRWRWRLWFLGMGQSERLRSRMSPSDRDRYDAEIDRMLEDARRRRSGRAPKETIGATPNCRICGCERLGASGASADRPIRLRWEPASCCGACGADDPDPVLVGRRSPRSVPTALWSATGFGMIGLGGAVVLMVLLGIDVARGRTSWLSFAILAPIMLAVMVIPCVHLIRIVWPWRHRDAGDQVWTLRDAWCEIEEGTKRRAVPWSSLEPAEGIVAMDSRGERRKGWPGIRIRRHDALDEVIVVPNASDRDAWLEAARRRIALLETRSTGVSEEPGPLGPPDLSLPQLGWAKRQAT